MNKTYLCVLPLTLLLAASSGYSVAGEPKRTTDSDNEPMCKGDPQTPMVNFNVNTMQAKPECVRAHEGTTILFRLTPKKDLEDVVVTIGPKKSFNKWLQGNNDTFNDVIAIRVPGKYEPERDHEYHKYDYEVVVGDTKIDPRVAVAH